MEVSCPFRHPCGLHRVTCDLVASLAGVDPVHAIVPARACSDCQLNPPTIDRPNDTVLHFAQRAVRRGNPDGSPAVIAMLEAYGRPDAAAAERTVVLNADLHGFGDAMVTAWIAEGSKDGPVKLIHHATGTKRDFLELFQQEVTPDAEGAVSTFRAYEIETRRERGSVPRVLSRGRQLGILSAPKRPRLRQLPAESLEWAAHLRIAHTEGEQKPFVLLFPQTCYRSREWPAAYWVDLSWTLWKSGYGVAFCLHPHDERFANSPRFYRNYSWQHTVALMLAADLVVGIDSAPIHVAGTLDRPTLALLGPTTPGVISHCPSVRCLSAPPERMECVGCVFNAPYRAACDQGCMALSRLFVEDVVDAIRELVPA